VGIAVVAYIVASYWSKDRRRR